jgi:hypothetical protein
MLNKIVFKNYFLAVLILSVFISLLPLALRNYLPPVVPVFYGRPYGPAQLVPTFWFITPLIVSLLVGAINFLISYWSKDLFVKKILAVSSLFICIIAVIAVVKVIFLVGFF